VTRRLGAFFERYDLLLTPTLGQLPAPLGVYDPHADPTPREFFDAWSGLEAYLPWFNCSGQTAISLPLHQSRDGLPIGIQLVARFGEEATLVRVAAHHERAPAVASSSVADPHLAPLLAGGVAGAPLCAVTAFEFAARTARTGIVTADASAERGVKRRQVVTGRLANTIDGASGTERLQLAQLVMVERQHQLDRFGRDDPRRIARDEAEISEQHEALLRRESVRGERHVQPGRRDQPEPLPAGLPFGVRFACQAVPQAAARLRRA